MNPSGTQVFLALGRGGWGEAAFGLHLAHQLKKQGQRVVFIAHANNARLFSDSPFEVHEVGDHLGTLAQTLITEVVCETKATSVLMADFLTTNGLLTRFGIGSSFLRTLQTHLIAVDTWDHSQYHREIDVFRAKKMHLPAWISDVPCIMPSPILRPDAGKGACGFLASPAKLSKTARAHVRANLGLGKDDVAVLFCTARWQQSAYADADGERIAAVFPELLARYLTLLGSNIHLVHVGPASLVALSSIGERYRWLPPLGNQFDRVLAACDLLISPNISASTVTKAICSSIPVVVLENSCRVETVEQADAWLGPDASPFVRDWIRTVLPLYPFRLWPLGFHEFLSPILERNPYCEAVESVEWLNERDLLARIDALIRSKDARIAHVTRQREYVKTVSLLPSASEAFDIALRRAGCAR